MNTWILTDMAGEHARTLDGLWEPLDADTEPSVDVERFATKTDAETTAASLRLADVYSRPMSIVRPKNYRVAFVLEASGDFEIVEQFSATSDDAANAYAEERYKGREWYVLDDNGKNING